MKKLIAALICAAAFVGASAQESVVRNGDFEKITKKAKATDKYLINQIKNGWDLGTGPLVELPSNWLVNNGKGKIRVITVGEKGENKENVHSGKHAIYFESRGGQYMNTAPNFKPGKYLLKFAVKGKGRLVFNSYYYGIHPNTGKIQKFLTSEKVYDINTDTANAWKEYSQEVEVGLKHKDCKACAFAIYGTSGAYYIDDISLTPIK